MCPRVCHTPPPGPLPHLSHPDAAGCRVSSHVSHASPVDCKPPPEPLPHPTTPTRPSQAFESSPDGGTPLCRHIREIIAQIQPMAPQLRAAGQKVALIIATDGEPRCAFPLFPRVRALALANALARVFAFVPCPRALVLPGLAVCLLSASVGANFPEPFNCHIVPGLTTSPVHPVTAISSRRCGLCMTCQSG